MLSTLESKVQWFLTCTIVWINCLQPTLHLGYQLGQVHLVFSFSAQAKKELFSEDNKPPRYLAYVEWFKRIPNSPQANHLLYCVKRVLNADQDRLASIIPVDSIKRSVHLFPSFDNKVPLE